MPKVRVYKTIPYYFREIRCGWVVYENDMPRYETASRSWQQAEKKWKKIIDDYHAGWQVSIKK